MIILLSLLVFLVPGNCDKRKIVHDSNVTRRDEPPKKEELSTISVIVGEESPTVMTYQINGCDLTLEKTDCKYTLSPSPDTCEGKISLADILERFFPANKLSEKTNTFFLPDKFDVNKVSMDKCKGEIEFKGAAKEKFEVIPKRLALKNTKLHLIFSYKLSSIEWSKLQLDLDGDLMIGEKAINTKLEKKQDQTAIKFGFKMDELAISDFTKLFTAAKPGDEDPNMGDRLDRVIMAKAKAERQQYLKGLQAKYFGAVVKTQRSKIVKKEESEKDPEVKVNTDQFTNLKIKNPKVSGFYDTEGSFEFTMTGLPTSAFFKGFVYAIVQKPKDGNTAVAVFASMENVSPTQILSKLTGKDLTTFPLLKDITINFAAMFANDDMPLIKDPEILNALKEYVGEGKAICKGVVLKMSLPVKEIIKKVDQQLKVDDVPDSLYCKIIVKDGNVDVKFPEEWKTDLLKILSALSPKAVELLPKFLRGKTPYVDVKVLSFDYKTMVFKSRVLAPGPLRLGNFFALKNVDIAVTFLGNENTWDFSFSSTQEILESVTFSTALSKKGNKYEFVGHIELISTKQLVDWIGAKFADKETMEKFKFLDFGIEDFKVVTSFATDSVDFFLRITGTCIMFGWNGVKLEGIISMHESIPKLTIGIALKDIRLDEIVSKLFDKQLLSATWLTQLNVGMVISTTSGDNKEILFTLPELKEMPIKPGFWFKALFQPPADCKKDELCLQAKEMMKDEKRERFLKLEGKITLTGADLRATYVGNWQIGNNIRIQDIVLAISVGKGTGVWFKVDVYITKPDLKLQGKIKVGVTGSVTLEAKMIGLWEKPFGLSYLAFGNIQIAIGIQPGIPVPMLKLEAEVQIGKIGSGKEIKAIAAVGINPTNPLKNYFYARINKLSIGSIAEAFGFENEMPQVLADSGFPDGVEVSFTLAQGKKLEVSGIEIPAGFALRGTISLLGLTLTCSIVVNFPGSFELKVDMAPIKFAGGALLVSRSRDDQENGPFFHAKVSINKIEVEIRGFVNILGISSQTLIKIGDSGYTFSVDGSLFGVINANMTVQASFASIETASFSVEACVSATAEQLTEEVKATAQESANEAEEAVKEAKDEAITANELGANAKEGKEKLMKEVEEYQEKIEKKAERYKEAKDTAKLKCIDECQNICLPFPDWNEHCMSIDGEYVGCPEMNPCKFKVMDEKCFSKCKGKSWFKTKVASARQTALKVLRAIFKQIRKMYNLGKKFFKASAELVSKSKAMLEKVGDFMKPGLELAKQIAKHTIDNLIKINHMCFKSGLQEAATKACVEFDIDAVVFKTRHIKMKTKGCLDVSFAKTIAKAIADHISPGINFIKTGISKVRTLIKEIDSQKEEIKAQIGEESQNDEDYDDEISEDVYDDDDSKKKYKIWAATDKKALHLINEEMPRMVVKDSAYIRKLRQSAAPVLAALNDPMAKAYAQGAAGNYSSKGILERDTLTERDPCEQVMGVVRSYTDLSTNLKRLVKKFSTQKADFAKAKKREGKKLDDIAASLRAHCVYYSCERGELEDIMSLVNTAKENHKKWAAIVESQINKQDVESIRVWRRSLDNIARKRDGVSLKERLTKLEKVSQKAVERGVIPSGQDQRTNLSEVGKELRAIFVDHTGMSISGVARRLVKMEPYLTAMEDVPKNCQLNKLSP